VYWIKSGAMIATAGKKLIASISVITVLLNRNRNLAME
jgi:hypothetical protein